ncbi:hypothetical protein PN494_00085 [Halorubrum ezzemoulense]|nr:hypothetical protein [Halorubrum ezzemoulense]MDB9285370.1 hypothetical protein [Halorubrum ezzemoulense]
MVWPAGYSGSNAVPSPDIIGVTPHGAHALELKNWNDTAHSIDESDLQQLLRVQKSYLDVALLIDFDRREPLLIEPVAPSLDAFEVDGGPSAAENFKKGVPSGVEAKVMDSGALRFYYPALDDWPSAKAGQSAVEKVREWMGIPAVNA